MRRILATTASLAGSLTSGSEEVLFIAQSDGVLGVADEMQDFVVGADEARERIDRLLARHVPSLSRSRLKALIEAGHVTLSGRTMTDAGQRVNQGDQVRLAVPEPEDPTPLGEAIPLTVVFEDDELIVIDKPAGLVVHPAAGHWTGTLVNALIAHCGASLSGIGGIRRPGIVHRLDKDTTGLMVVAKTDRAHVALSRQFADHGRSGPLERAYVALVWGRPKPDHFTVDEPLDRDPRNRERIAVRKGGREAITHVGVETAFLDGLVAEVSCRLETGRTHQIRVHMAHRGHPLLGDETYAKGFKTKTSKLPDAARLALEALGRQALHAAVLGFEHPTTGKVLHFESLLPADMQHLVDALGAPV
ncbi:RluA family pseudouridine synthase [Phreatobacter stygius]|uniref:Pseudouridine synthase n=2 Tax=Phreatobacter stygius TaxID=1940610 RepID=A0A4D7BF35_9HYPH|nr:RluA family pseudouridine synthase [Phreatobacter stygius]